MIDYNKILFKTNEVTLPHNNSVDSISRVLYNKFFKHTFPKKHFFIAQNLNNEIIIASPEFKDKFYDVMFYISVKRRIKKLDDFLLFFNNHYFKIFSSGILLIRQNTNNMQVAYCGDDDVNEVLDFFNENTIEFEEKKDDKIHYRFIKTSLDGYKSVDMCFDKMDIDISKNYNDDFDYEKFKNLQLSDMPTLTLLHGIPGTGKTTILKKLINDIDDPRKVYYMDCNMMTSFSDGSFFDFALTNLSKKIVILEDCESILRTRNKGTNKIMSTILNMTDGFISSYLKIHFIFTFNCPLNEIDKALLRKGRLNYRYDFRELKLDKCKLINPLATKPMTLAELYNMEEEVCTQMAEKGIGFA